MTDIILKQGTGVPQAADLEVAEIAIDNSTGDLYTKLADLSVKRLNPEGTGGGTGSSVHIGENPPADPQEGQQWMEVPASGDATMWIYDSGNGGQWLQHPSGGGSGGNDDGLWATENNSVTYRSGDDSGVYIYDTRDAGMFHRAQICLVNEGTNSGGWLGAQSDALQIGSVVGSSPENPDHGVKNPIITLHNNGQCSVGYWQLPPTDEKFYVNGTARITASIQAADFLDADGNSIIGSGGGGGNNIADGTQDGIVATWNDTTGQWTPDSSLVIDASGDATFSGLAKAKTVLATFGGVNPVAGFAVAASDSIDTPALLPANASGAIDNAVDIGRQAFSGNQAFRWRNAHFSGTVSASNSFVTGNNIWREGHSGLAFGLNYIVPRDKDLNPSTASVDIGQNGDRFKDGHFNGTVYSNGSPLTRTVDLIKTLSTLRNATKDETTLEGLRDAIGNAIGGLIEEFENQIATMPAEDEA